MENHKQVPLVRYPDGTPSVLSPRTDYSKLHFYQKSDVLVQLTQSFCERFLPKWGDRTVDQMVHASRSILLPPILSDLDRRGDGQLCHLSLPHGR